MARCALIHKLFDNRHNSQNNFCKYAHLLLCLQQLSHFKVKRVKISKKIMESEFPCNMQIYTLCPKCLIQKLDWWTDWLTDWLTEGPVKNIKPLATLQEDRQTDWLTDQSNSKTLYPLQPTWGIIRVVALWIAVTLSHYWVWSWIKWQHQDLH